MGGWRGNAFIYPGQVRLGLQHELPSHRPPPSPSQFSRKWGRDGSSHGGVLQRPGLPLSKLRQEGGPGLGPCPWCTLQPLTLGRSVCFCLALLLTVVLPLEPSCRFCSAWLSHL